MMQPSIVMKHLPLVVAAGLVVALGSSAVAEPAQPKAWFDELPTHVARSAGTTGLVLEERVASKQAALARAEQRITETRTDWNHADLHWFGWPAGPVAERHHEAVVERDQLQRDLFRAEDERDQTSSDQLALHLRRRDHKQDGASAAGRRWLLAPDSHHLL